MLISLYIEQYALDIIRCYGEPEDVVNRMLDEADGELFDVFDKPSPGPRENAVRIVVDVTNEDYLALMATMPINSPRISLRRFVHWFVDNEMFDQLGWQPSARYKQRERDRVRKTLASLSKQINDLYTLYDKIGCDGHNAPLDVISTQLNILKELKI